MRVAEFIDTHEMKKEMTAWFVGRKEEVMEMLAEEQSRVKKQRKGNTGGQRSAACMHVYAIKETNSIGI